MTTQPPVTDDVDALLAEFEENSASKLNNLNPARNTPVMGGVQRSVYHAPTAYTTYAGVGEDSENNNNNNDDNGLEKVCKKQVHKLDPLALPSKHATRGTGGNTFGLRSLNDIVEEKKEEENASLSTPPKGVGSSRTASPRTKRAAQMMDPIPQVRPQLMVCRHNAKTGSTWPKGRWGSTLVPHDNVLYMFGGYGEGGVPVQDFQAYSVEDKEWEIAFCAKGSAPTPRGLHTAVMYKEEMIVYGGSNGQELADDMLAYNVRTQSWRTIVSQNPPPPPRCGHSCVLIQSTLYIFGGRALRIAEEGGSTKVSLTNDFIKYDLKTNQWSGVARVEGAPVGPSKRSGHAACVSFDNPHCFYIHGGEGRSQERYNDLWEFNTVSGVWREVLPQQDDIGNGKFRHTLVSGGGNVVVAVGGGVTGNSSSWLEIFTLGGGGDDASVPAPGRYPLQTWGALPSSANTGAAACMMHGFLFSFGGVESTKVNNVLSSTLLLTELSLGATTCNCGGRGVPKPPTENLWNHYAETSHNIVIEYSGNTLFAHTFVLQARAPVFLEKLLETVVEREGSSSSGNSSVQHCSLDGNRRKQGMTGIPSFEVLHAFLAFLYTGKITLKTQESSAVGGDEFNDGLNDMAVTFQVTRLMEVLAASTTTSDLRRGGRVHSQTAKEERMTAIGAKGLEDDLQAYLEQTSGTVGDATLVVEDPYTHAIVDVCVPRALLIAASPLVRKTWGKTNASKFQVRAPHVAVPVLLQYLYTGTAQVLPGLSIPVLIASSAMGIVGLKNITEVVAYRGLTVETVVDVFSLSHIHKARYLAMQCVELILYLIASKEGVPNLGRLTDDVRGELQAYGYDCGVQW